MKYNFFKFGETRETTPIYGGEKIVVQSCYIFFICLFLFYLDVDECKKPNACRYNYRCENLPNSYSCKCDGGYKLTGPKEKCKGKFIAPAEFFRPGGQNPRRYH